MREATSSDSTLYYFAADHLGSTSLTMDASGFKIGEMKYMPFGETRYTWGGTPTDRHFTGQREENGLGSLYDYGARMYSPVLGRFISADTLVPSASDPQSLNRYAYTLNNPLKYVDPTGHYECAFVNSPCPRDPYALAERLTNQYIVGGSAPSWNELSATDQEALAMRDVGTDSHGTHYSWNENIWNSETGHSCGVCSVAGRSMDPAVWIAEAILLHKIGSWLPEALGSSAAETASGAESTSLTTYWPPNRGFIGETERKFLMPGEVIDRYGLEGGTFVAPEGTPFEMRSLPQEYLYTKPYHAYEVLKPLEVTGGTTAPAFGQIGLGVSYELPVPVSILLKRGFLGEIIR